MAGEKTNAHIDENDGDEYYYTDRRRVQLKRARGFLAVDIGRLQPNLAKRVASMARKAKAPARRGVVVMERKTLSRSEWDELCNQQEALMPVFRDGDSLIVVLPEVRVEAERTAARKRVLEWLASREDLDYDVQRGRIVIHMRSLNGRDALHVANAIHEELEPELSQARFVRIVRRPTKGQA